PSVDRDDTAAGMRAGATEVDPGHGCAIRQAAIPHKLRQALTLEDVAASQADLALDIRRTQHVDVDDRVREVADVASNRGDAQPLDLLEARVPVALGDRVWHILREDAHRVHAIRCDRGVVDRLEVEFGPELLRQLTTSGRHEAVAPGLLREWRVDLAGVV